MEKSVFIGGVSRSGKSTLAAMVRQNNPQLSALSGDSFVSTFQRIYPELGISHQQEHGITCKNLDAFLFMFLEKLNKNENIPFVFDTFHVMPDQIARRGLQHIYKVVFLGYPDMTAEQKLQEIRQFDAQDSWTQEIDDTTLLEWVGEFIAHSKQMKAQCEEHAITFIDTGARGYEPALEEALKILSN